MITHHEKKKSLPVNRFTEKERKREEDDREKETQKEKEQVKRNPKMQNRDSFMSGA